MKFASVALVSVLFCPLPVAAAATVTDAEIASIVVTANQVDVDAGQLAAARTANSEVKAFAELMVTDHTAVNKSATDLAKQLKLTPKNNATSDSLKEAGEKNLQALKQLSGTPFDRAYVDHEVAYHQQVLDAIDTTLIPDARNADLKALLVKVRPAFVAHLQHAQALQASLKAAK